MRPQIKKPSGGLGLVTTTNNFNFKAKLKQVVVQLACYGLIPLGLADWLISVGGLSDE
jgi:hypothetical protein